MVTKELQCFILPDFTYGPGMPLLESFLDPSTVSLKICGVTTRDDAERLVALGVDALGVNFWPKSKRYLDPEHAGWLRDLAGRILRVGVFVNEDAGLSLRLVRDGLLDVVQLHGDETPVDALPYQNAGVPFIKAIGVKTIEDLKHAESFGARAILLDAHAPGVYGGTGDDGRDNQQFADRDVWLDAGCGVYDFQCGDDRKHHGDHQHVVGVGAGGSELGYHLRHDVCVFRSHADGVQA